MKITLSIVMGLAFAGAIGLQTANAESTEDLTLDGIARLQRFAQYELLAGVELDGRLSVCVDDVLGQGWLLEPNGSTEIRPAVMEKLRRTIEGCSALNGGTAKRLTSQLREMTERQLALAQRLEKPANQVRGCVNDSKTSDVFRACLSQAVGTSNSAQQWNKWRVIFERKNQN